jgi:cysteinyl-tRNA synthetase
MGSGRGHLSGVGTLAGVPDVTLYDTKTRSLQPFEPRDPAKVGIYACGPTVYGRVHVGNARPFIVFSQLKRFLVHEGYGVTLVGNITDINDKIYDAAKRDGRPSGELAAEMADWYVKDTDRLGLGRPDAEPYATEYVGQIVELIQRLIDGGSAYACEGDVYFRVRTISNYGELSRRDVDQMDQGEGVEGADLKEDPLDFALWKATKEGEDTSWDAPWGRGRPGWHIECSAMAEALLGVEFDIHGGGVDLVFPHHENEAAQTLAARGKPLARIWMHNGMLELAAEKMSKSVGNIRGLGDVLDEVEAEVFVLFMSTGHYRQPLAFSDEALQDARRSAARIREAGRRLIAGPSPASLEPFRDGFFAALRNDFNTAEALASLYGWIREANRSEEAVGNAHLVEMLDVLGLSGLLAAEEGAPPEAVALAEQRETARREKNWAEADRLRDELGALGWEIRDGPDGPELVRANLN